MNRKILEENGVDYAAGVRRFMEDRELYEEMLTAFLSDGCCSKAAEAFDKRDYTALFEQAHTLKGASGNLDMPQLYCASSELTEFLRHNSAPDEYKLSELFDKVRAEYARVVNGIRAACAQ